VLDLSRPINLISKDFARNKFAYYEQLREQKPVQKAKISVIRLYTVSRYEDCTAILKDPRVVRNRTVATGGSRFLFPMPKSIKALAYSMITEDDPNHRRLRNLVRLAFRPQAINLLESRVEQYTDELLDGLAGQHQIDLQTQFALQVPTRMIADMMGIDFADMPKFQQALSVVSKGFSGWRMLRTLFLDFPNTAKFMRGLINKKRENPGPDILTGLIQAEDEQGDRLTEDELLAMTFLLLFAGFETTVHLISNGVLTLLQHPDQLERLRSKPTLIDSAVEEILRHRGPIQGTKPNYLMDDVELHGVTIPKGQPVMPLLGAANHDPRVFHNPLEFDIGRDPNRHLGFGHGVHFCLGAHLARMEAKIAIGKLFQRFPDLALAVDADALVVQNMPGWHRYAELPVATQRLRQAA